MSEEPTAEKDAAALKATLRLHRGGFTTGPYEADDGWRCACGAIVLTEGLSQHALDAWEAHLCEALAASGVSVLPPGMTELGDAE